MRYILKENYALRGYEDAPYMLFDLSRKEQSRILTPKGFAMLHQCDGVTDITPNDFTKQLVEEKVIQLIDESQQTKHCERSPRQQYSYNPHKRLLDAQIAITGRCNYNCLHCFSSSKQERLQEEFSLEKIFEILEQLDEAGVHAISITGGEPLLHPHFLDILKKCKELGLKVREILTNGSLLTCELLAKMRAMEISPLIGISFDGLGSHDYLRNKKGAQESAIKAFQNAIAYGFKTKATINVNQNSLEKLIETCRFLVNLGCKHLFLIRTSETPKWVHSGGKFTPFDTYYSACLDVVDVFMSENWDCELQIFNGPHFINQKDKQKVYAENAQDTFSGKLTACFKCAQGCFIAHDGRVIPCDAFEGMSTAYNVFQDSNLYEHSLYDLLQSSQFATFRQSLLEHLTIKNSDCKNCEWLYSCRGGCRAFGFGMNGDFSDSSPLHCTYFRGGHAKMLKELVTAHETGEAFGQGEISEFRKVQKEKFALALPNIQASMPKHNPLPTWGIK